MLISWLQDIVKHLFSTPDGAMGLTFQLNYISSRFVFHLTKILIINQIPYVPFNSILSNIRNPRHNFLCLLFCFTKVT